MYIFIPINFAWDEGELSQKDVSEPGFWLLFQGLQITDVTIDIL